MKYKFTFSLLLLFNCSSFQLSKHDGFIDWLNGKPGMKNTEFISKNPRSGVVIGERHPYYLWFRTPEIIFNPQGGLYYPDMFIMVDYELYDTTDLSSVKDEKYKLKILNRRNGQFTRVDEGLIDYLFQYRELIDPSGQVDFAIQKCILFPLYLLFTLPEKIVIYPIHDVIKTVMIPVAAVYYTVKAFDDNGEEEPAE